MLDIHSIGINDASFQIAYIDADDTQRRSPFAAKNSVEKKFGRCFVSDEELSWEFRRIASRQ